MKLSEAIKLGSMLRPQGFGKGFDGTGTCAMGAADEAMGATIDAKLGTMHSHGTNRPEWSWAKKGSSFGDVPCPVCRSIGSPASRISVHLNDEHRWTRERIADWVATIEPQEVLLLTHQPIVEEPQLVEVSR